MPDTAPPSSAARYLALRARAVRFVERAGGAADEPALVEHVLGAPPARPWRQLLARILADDARLLRDADGRWRLRQPTPRTDDELPLDYVALELGLMGSRGRRVQLVEIAALRVRGGQVVARLASAVQPSRRVTAYAQRAARLDLESFAGAPVFDALADDLVAFVDRDPLVGYDLQPQLAALGGELRQSGRPELASRTVDLLTWLLDRGLVHGKPTLAAALRAVGCGEPPTARAADRATALVHLLAALRRGAPQDLAGAGPPAVAAPRRRPSPADTAPQAAVFAAPPADADTPVAAPPRSAVSLPLPADPPATPGVYLLCDATGAALYVGTARDLRQRLRSYSSLAVRQVRRMEGLHARVAGVAWETTPSELSARLLEAQRIAQLRPPYNVQRRAARQPAYLVARPTGAYLRLEATAHPGAGERCAGPFASARGARQAWHVLSDLFALHTCRRSFRARRRRPPCARHTVAGLCPAPCVATVTPDDYAERVAQALAFLAGERDAALVAARAALAAAQRAGDRGPAERLAHLVARARALPTIPVGNYTPELLDGMVPAPAEADRSPWSGDAPAAELFCLRDDALHPLQPVDRPGDATAVARALAAALAGAPLAPQAAFVARAWLRQRPAAAVLATTRDAAAAAPRELAAALAAAWAPRFGIA
ncbi:MAG: GIY-YIG nuclease family protein [Chloroflexi bacterium]|nr:GIY-YIG nuclease family protein [Chloroflexota bacterium]